MDSSTKYIGCRINWNRDLILEVLSFYLVLLFAYAGLSKIMDINPFYNALRNEPLNLNSINAAFLGWFIPLIEIIGAIAIGFQKYRKYGFLVILSLLIAFTSYNFWIVAISPNIPCTCGGLISLLSWRQHLIFNILNLIFTLGGILLIHKNDKDLYRDRSGM